MRYFRATLVVALSLCRGQAQYVQTVTESSTPESLAPGTPSGSYGLSDVESIDPFNGGLDFVVPLLKIGGRGRAGYNMVLPIQHQWDAGDLFSAPTSPQSTVEIVPFITTAWWSGALDPYGPGVVIGRSAFEIYTCTKTTQPTSPYPDLTVTTLTFIEPNGTEHLLIDTLTNGQPAFFQEAAVQYPNGLICVQTAPTSAPTRGTIFEAADGSGITFYSSAPIIDNYQVTSGQLNGAPAFYPSGQLAFANGVIYDVAKGLVDWIRDANGNTVAFQRISSGTNSGEIQQITDPLGRTVSISYGQTCTASLPGGGGSVPSTDTCDFISYTGYQGAARTIQIANTNFTNILRSGYTAEAESTLFVNSAFLNSVPSIEVPAAVTFPNNQGYQFQYSSYADLARATLPTGGAFEYDWGGVSGESSSGLVAHGISSIAILRRVYARRVYSSSATNSSLTRTDSYTAPANSSSTDLYGGFTNSAVTETTTDASGNLLRQIVHSYYGSQANFGPLIPVLPQLWQDGKEYEADLESAGGATLQKTQSVWQARAPDVNWTITVQISGDPQYSALPQKPATCQANETIDGVTSGRVMFYDTATQYNNLKDLYEYDYGSAPAITAPLSFPVCSAPTNYLRHTNKAYLTSGYDTTPNVHIRDLVTSETVFATGGSQVANTVYSYDTAAPQSVTGTATGVSPPSAYGITDFVQPSAALRGNLNSVARWWKTPTQVDNPPTTTFIFDSLGNVLSKTDPLGSVTTYSFADNFVSGEGPGSGLNTFAFPTAITNAIGQATTLQYEYWIGRPATITDPNTAVTHAQYADPLERLTGVTLPTGSLSYGYSDTPGSVSVSKTTAQSSCGTSNALVSTSDYDGLGRESATVATGDAGVTVTAATTYDGLDRVLTKTLPYYGATASCSTSYSYDALSRVLTTQNCDGATSYTGYQAGQSVPSHQTVTVDPAGIWKALATDGAGRLIQVVEDPTVPGMYASGNPIPSVAPGQVSGAHTGTNVLTGYQYDGLDDLSQVQQSSQTRTFQYDSLKQLATAVNPENGTTSYLYDSDGNVSVKKDNRAISTYFTYDQLNRTTGKSYSDGTPSVSMVYDENEGPVGTTTYPIGRLSQVSVSGGSETSFYYNNMGWPLGSTQTTLNQSFPFSYSYNLAGGLAAMTYPSGRQAATCYDSLARSTSLTGTYLGATTPYASAITYQPDGQLSAQTLGNGLAETVAYNQRLQPTSFSLMNGGTSVLGLGFNYTSGSLTNNNGNVWSQTIANLGATQTYAYDPLNRLWSVAETANSATTWSESFGYDNYGNRWVPSATGIGVSALTPTSSGAINAATNQLIGPDYGFDAAGNQAFMSPWVIAFDAESRVAAFTSASNGSGSYTYDGAGRRVTKTVGSTTTVYVYDAKGQRAAEYSSSVTAPPCTTCYETADNLGSLRAVTNGSGAAVALHDYAPFGEELSTANRTVAVGYGSSDGLVDRFTGKERDAETGLDYFGARYLSSTEGRFASTDPIYLMPQKLMDPQQWNLYAYVRNNPLRFLDPTGMYLASCGDGVKGCDKQVTKLDSAIQTALKSNNSDVVKAAQAYGKLGDDNGVNVTIVKVVDPKHPDVTGKVTEQAGTGGFTVDPATGQVKQATQVSIRAGMGSSQLEETAVHEGQHVLDRANFVNSISNGSQFNRLLNITGRQSERNAYGVENEWLGLHGQPARNIDEILSRPPYSDSPTIDMPLFPAIPGAQP